jgi:hypothetical protein
MGVVTVATILLCCQNVASASRKDTEDEKRATKNIALHAKAVEEAPITTSLTEQNQIDGIKSVSPFSYPFPQRICTHTQI